MADQIKATPRSPILGLFSDIVNLPLEYMSAPERTQQSQGVAQFLYGTGIPKTLERMSYGESLLSGSGGLGGTTRMRPETAEALLNVAPFAPAVGRLASRAVKATEGLPVGMSIRSVKAPQETALALAQQRAALPVSEGGLGLPANNTPMDRAKAMGFDTEAFHITPKEFSQFKVGGYDPTLSGEAIWLSPYKDVQPASHNVGGYPNYKEGSRILPLFVKVQKPLVIDDPTSLDWARKVFAGGSREFPQLISPKSAKELQLNDEYKSILFQGEDLGWGNKSNEIMIFNPSDIRSRFAAFDPFRKDVATATAMGVALPDLLAQPVNQVQPTYETNPMYTDPFGNTIGSSIR